MCCQRCWVIVAALEDDVTTCYASSLEMDLFSGTELSYETTRYDTGAPVIWW